MALFHVATSFDWCTIGGSTPGDITMPEYYLTVYILSRDVYGSFCCRASGITINWYSKSIIIIIIISFSKERKLSETGRKWR